MGRDTTNRPIRRRAGSDRTRRGVLIAVLLIIVLVGVTSAAGLAGVFGSGEGRRNTGVVPRYIDVWGVYPNESLRFVTLFHPLPSPGETVEVAGPLVLSEVDVLESEVIGGGELVEVTYEPGPGEDSAYVFPLFRLAREAGSDETYGIDVQAQNLPYLSADPLNPAQRILSLGTKEQTYYAQVVVAVALPAGTEVTEMPDLQPYRQTQVGGWDVYYFDTTSVQAGAAIQLTYTPVSGSAPSSLNYERIDARR